MTDGTSSAVAVTNGIDSADVSQLSRPPADSSERQQEQLQHEESGAGNKPPPPNDNTNNIENEDDGEDVDAVCANQHLSIPYGKTAQRVQPSFSVSRYWEQRSNRLADSAHPWSLLPRFLL